MNIINKLRFLVVFLFIFKVLEIVDWGWIWVFSPIWVPLLLLIAIPIFYLCICVLLLTILFLNGFDVNDIKNTLKKSKDYFRN